MMLVFVIIASTVGSFLYYVFVRACVRATYLQIPTKALFTNTFLIRYGMWLSQHSVFIKTST